MPLLCDSTWEFLTEPVTLLYRVTPGWQQDMKITQDAFNSLLLVFPTYYRDTREGAAQGNAGHRRSSRSPFSIRAGKEKNRHGFGCKYKITSQTSLIFPQVK